MLSTMGQEQLTIAAILRHGRNVHGGSVVSTYDGERFSPRSYTELAGRAERLAAALRGLGVGAGDRVATLCWNHAEHHEAYFAVPCMGAVLLTLNFRLSRDQLTFIGRHAEPRVLIADASLLEAAGAFVQDVPSIEHVIVVGEEYESLLASGPAGLEWPELDERQAAVMCYTTGTTGDPKGVVYGHRSTYLHALATCTGNGFALSERDRILVFVAMFHATAWGLPYAGWAMGSDFLMPREFVQGEHLARMIELGRATFAGGVPSVWDDVLSKAVAAGRDLSSLRVLVCGGAPVPKALIERWRREAGVPVIQGWGMTETSPLAALARAPKHAGAGEEDEWHAKTGRPIQGVDFRVVDAEGSDLPHDGVSVGELLVRGPWVTTSYYKNASPESFRDGWLSTGDVGTIDEHGYVQITDRLKDVIKSGGEWISSVDLENELMGHPDVLEACVIGVADERWQERPLACVVARADTELSFDDLRSFLTERVARWWLPERWAVLPEIPKTSVGKFDKKLLRQRYEENELPVERVTVA